MSHNTRSPSGPKDASAAQVGVRKTSLSFVIGLDIGGTFTDIVAVGSDGHIAYAKTPSTPGDYLGCIMAAVDAVAERLGIGARELLVQTAVLAHGTTATTNAFIERRGARVGFVTTRGFRDLLLLLKGERGTGLAEANRLVIRKVHKPQPMVPYELCAEVTERLDYRGEVVVSLDEDDVRRAGRGLAALGVEGIAVCLLWSHRNPMHELRVREILAEELPGVGVVLSHEHYPVKGEYERAVTTVLDCYLAPILHSYVGRLDGELRRRGFGGTPLLMQSLGGVIPAMEAAAQPSATINSGPVGGIIASQYLGEVLGVQNVIATDMGGTSFDVGLIIGGKPLFRTISVLPESDPFTTPYRTLIPSVEIESIGAGGGSIARVEHGTLVVGPQSAGADPGPACYGCGGAMPTVTDADLVLGHLDPDYFLGGAMKLHPQEAERAIDEHVAGPLGLDVVRAAVGIGKVVNSQMADLIRRLTIERGHDPRRCVLFAYGGAGPTHCGSYGRNLGVGEIVVPSGLASEYSAFGIAATDLRRTLVLADHMVPLDAERINRNYARLREQAQDVIRRWNLSPERASTLRYMDLKYRRQLYTITTPIPDRDLGPGEEAIVRQSFEAIYERLYGRGSAHSTAPLEAVNFRLEVVGRMDRPKLQKHPAAGPDPSAALKGERPAYFEESDGYVATPVYDGEALRAGHRLVGPSIVEFLGTTVVIHPGQRAEVDPYLNIVIREGSA